jgi:hypothetical protein
MDQKHVMKKINSSKNPENNANHPAARTVTLVYLFISILFFLAYYDFYQGFILIGNPPSFASKRFDAFLAFTLLPLGLWIYGLKLAFDGILHHKLYAGYLKLASRLPFVVRIILAVFFLFLPAYLFLYSSFSHYQFIYWLRLFTLLGFGFLSALLVFPEKVDYAWLLKAAGSVVLVTLIFVMGDWLTNVTDYPFSLGWSEGNRFWDYSIMFGFSRYLNPSGQAVVPFLEAGRQLLWAIPFAIPGIGIQGMRLWNVLVWVIPPFLLGFFAIFRASTFKTEWVWQFGVALWVFLFLSQGPIYPPLVVCAIAVVIGLRQKNLPLAILLVAVASYYARISRWTWMYAPGLWAGMLALVALENPSFKNGRWKELIRPVVLGLSGLAGAEIIPMIVSQFSTGMVAAEGSMKVALADSFNFKQPMLWDRMLPNPTYAPGILLGYLWVAGPVILLLAVLIIQKIWKPNWMQKSALAVIIGGFTVAGLIVSVKIGGGSNLHNLDMLWVTLALLSAWVFRDWLDRGLPGLYDIKIKSVLAALCIATIFPTTSMIQYGEPYNVPGQYFVESSLEKLNTEVQQAKLQGEVLFLDQRQLLTFGYIKDVPLVAEYEKKLVMDQALSGNQAYFDGFYKDLQNHRFSMIVTEPIRKSMADEDTRNFGEENNAWVYWVSRPLLKYYKAKVTYDEVGVQLLVPREN